MCGIVGAIANRDVVPLLVEGLKRLEYRGYDSAGIAVVAADEVRRVRRTGRVAEMESAALAEGFDATLGIHPTAAEEFVLMREPSREVAAAA